MKSRIIVTGGSGFIGCFLVRELIRRNYDVLNLDIKPPVDGLNLENWKHTSILDFNVLKQVFVDYNPDYVVHLAAVALQDSKSLKDFDVNIHGTRNLIHVINKIKNLKKTIYTSTQYVHIPGEGPPNSLLEYMPYGFYGMSKLIGELDVCQLSQKSNWTIIRPTAIWGPYHPVLARGLWKQISRGWYFHPTKDRCIKPYGYVENAVWQIAEILERGNYLTDEKTYYLADSHMQQSDWVEMFSKALNRKFRRVPKLSLFMLAKLGDIIRLAGFDFPLYSSRYGNLFQHNEVPLQKTLDLLGPSPVLPEVGVQRTMKWFKNFQLEKLS